MNKRIRAAILLLLVLLLFSAVLAQTGSFDLPWHSVDGGGGSSEGGGFGLRGAIGQSDSGVLSGGDFTVEGGFLVQPIATGGGGKTLFLPLLEKPS